MGAKLRVPGPWSTFSLFLYEALKIDLSICKPQQQLDLVLKEDSAIAFRPGLNVSELVLRRLDERTKDARIEIEVEDGTTTDVDAGE